MKKARMTEIDIDSLDEATLMDLNRRIVERLQLLHQQKTTAALQDIRIGSGVTFEGPGGTLVRGFVIRCNRKTVTVHTDDDKQWNVSPSLLTLTGKHMMDEVSIKRGGVVPFLKPDRR
ncbi:hypothetical protein [Ochrobactrum sp. S1502_03]|uniref:hypothetical protein n=1 Tax=Ochrobactrum sp. S1502_03 TaxID=3108451 RepID=UPI0037C86D96